MIDDQEQRRVPQLPVDPRRSALMKRVRRKGTRPELLVAAGLRSLGLSYRKNVGDLPGSPDFVNRRLRWAIFVQGCYWHHHRCKRGTVPKGNREFWVAKFAANRKRDARKARQLRALGLRVILVWECEATAGEPMMRKLRVLARETPTGRSGSDDLAQRFAAGSTMA